MGEGTLVGWGMAGAEGQEEPGTGWRCRRLLVSRAGLALGLGVCTVPSSGSISRFLLSFVCCFLQDRLERGGYLSAS